MKKGFFILLVFSLIAFVSFGNAPPDISDNDTKLEQAYDCSTIDNVMDIEVYHYSAPEQLGFERYFEADRSVKIEILESKKLDVDLLFENTRHNVFRSEVTQTEFKNDICINIKEKNLYRYRYNLRKASIKEVFF